MIGTQYKEACTDRKCAFQRCPSHPPHYKAQKLHRSMRGDSAQSSHAASPLQTRTSRCSHWKCQGKAVRWDDFRKTIWGAPLSPSCHSTPPSMSATQCGQKLSWGNSVWGKDGSSRSSDGQRQPRAMALKRHWRQSWGAPLLPFEVEQLDGCRGCSETSALTSSRLPWRWTRKGVLSTHKSHVRPQYLYFQLPVRMILYAVCLSWRCTPSSLDPFLIFSTSWIF